MSMKRRGDWDRNMSAMHQLCFYVPETHAAAVKAAVFAAGAGQFGNYDQCSWETAGTGQFRPLAGSRPFLGREGGVETVRELKIELPCAEEHVAAVVAALKAAHPYETPAFCHWPVAGVA